MYQMFNHMLYVNFELNGEIWENEKCLSDLQPDTELWINILPK